MLLAFLFVLLVICIAVVKQAIVNTVMQMSHRVSGKPHIGIWLYAVLFFPGTVIHELSHWFIAELLQVRTGKMHLFPKKEENFVKLGYVQVGKADPFRMLLIGSAPFFVGLLSISIIVLLQFSFLRSTSYDVSLLLSDFFGQFQDPITWVFCYILIVLSHAMFLSEADRREIILVPILGIVIGIIFWFTHDWFSLPQTVTYFIARLFALLNVSLIVVLAFNAVLFVVLFSMRKLFEKVF